MFTCPHHSGNLLLSETACASMWRRARKDVHPWDRLHVCHGCGIGAEHAGEARRPEQPKAHECLRCGSRAKRLIRGQICVSCYNREREVITGRYRRGVPPKNLSVARMRVVVAAGEPVETIAASPAEALLAAVRHCPGQPIIAVTAGACPPWSAVCAYPQLAFLPGIASRSASVAR